MPKIHKLQPLIKSIKMQDKPKPTEGKVKTLNKIFSNCTRAAIARKTGYDYQIIDRTLNGEIVRWDERHTKVVEAAEAILNDNGAVLKE